MLFLTTTIEYLFVVFLHNNQVKAYPQVGFPTRKEVPHRVDCTISLGPAPAVGGMRETAADEEVGGGCECVPYYLCNGNMTANAGVGLSTVGLVSTPPYKPCPCAQATSEPKPNNSGVCPKPLDVCCTPQPNILSDEDPDSQPSWNDISPGNAPPWQSPPGIPGNQPPWFNNSAGNSPPWNDNNPGDKPSWDNKPGNPTTWNGNSPGNNRPWGGNPPGRPPWKPQNPGNRPPWKEKYPGCGRYFNNGFGFQDRGYLRQRGSIPWMVAVFGEKIVNGVQKRNSFLCGGSLVNPGMVLTAAHCVKGKSQLMVQTGTWNFEPRGERQLVQKPIHHVKMHEDYYAGGLYNDVALLFLETPLEGDNVATVCLPEPGHRVGYSDCIVSGWGVKAFGENENYGSDLKKIELSIVPREFCEEKLQTTRLGRYFHLHQGFMCATGKRGEDACTGDGGGPLMCPSLDVSDCFVQVGVVSWGIGCGGDIPGVYANVSHYLPWIKTHMAAQSVDERL